MANEKESEGVKASSVEKGKEHTKVVAKKDADDLVAENATISKSDLKDVSDEVCPDEVYLDVKNQKSDSRRMCSLEMYPEDVNDFRNKVENYFQQRTDVIEKVIDFKVEHFGTRVKLVCLLSKRRWLGFFNDPQGCYSDLTGIQRVIHACKDISDCDKVPG